MHVNDIVNKIEKVGHLPGHWAEVNGQWVTQVNSTDLVSILIQKHFICHYNHFICHSEYHAIHMSVLRGLSLVMRKKRNATFVVNLNLLTPLSMVSRVLTLYSV